MLAKRRRRSEDGDPVGPHGITSARLQVRSRRVAEGSMPPVSHESTLGFGLSGIGGNGYNEEDDSRGGGREQVAVPARPVVLSPVMLRLPTSNEKDPCPTAKATSGRRPGRPSRAGWRGCSCPSPRGAGRLPSPCRRGA